MSKEFGNIQFDEALPRLVANYNRGKLVPFTGAGISMQSIPGWQKMISKICTEHNIPFPEGTSFNSQQLVQLSERIVTELTRQSYQTFITSIEKSLGYGGLEEPAVTPQCDALAQLWWPLILTTNYDRMLVTAYNSHHVPKGRSEMKVFGRNPTDCHTLLSIVNAATGPSYWALQGYLGKSTNKNDLTDEIVMGHRQYRNATYSNPTFRAVFGEIYRNHSLLFLGSGLSEDYFMGLFGEVLEKYGRNPYTHCALYSEQDIGNIDQKFLLTRLNIVAVFYPDQGEKYAGLCNALNSLTAEIHKSSTKLWKVGYGNRSFTPLTNKHSPLELEIIAATLPDKKEGECIVFSAGLDEQTVLLSHHGITYIRQHHHRDYDSEHFRRLGGKLKCWQYQNSAMFAAVARNDGEGTSHDRRDLRTVQEAFRDTILALFNKYSVINIMLLAAGSGRIFPPVHALIAMIRGYKEALLHEALKDADKINCTIKIHVVDPSVLAYIRRNPLEIEEIISCDDIRLNVEIRDHQGKHQEIERFQIYLREDISMEGVSNFFSIQDNFWDVHIEPLPYTGQQLCPSSKEVLSLIGLIPGSTIVYSRKQLHK